MKMLVTSFDRNPERLAELARQHGVEFVVPPRDQPTAPLMGDVDALFGQLQADEFASAKQLRWVQSSSAGVEWMWEVPGIAESDVVVTNMRGAHAATIAEHAFAMLLDTGEGKITTCAVPGKAREIKLTKDKEKLWIGFNDERGRYHDNHIGKGRRHELDPLWVRIEVVRIVVD